MLPGNTLHNIDPIFQVDDEIILAGFVSASALNVIIVLQVTHTMCSHQFLTATTVHLVLERQEDGREEGKEGQVEGISVTSIDVVRLKCMHQSSIKHSKVAILGRRFALFGVGHIFDQFSRLSK